MKKVLALMVIGLMLGAGSYYSAANAMPPPNEQAKQQFEKRLNLTEKQKKKAKTIHQKGLEKMKPLMSEIAQKRKELKALKESNDPAKEEKISQKKEELKKLNDKAHKVRKKNGKDFEKILTKEQKTELEKMKAEGRAKFHKKHPPKPPFNMFDGDGFWNKKGLFPPPPPPKEEK